MHAPSIALPNSIDNDNSVRVCDNLAAGLFPQAFTSFFNLGADRIRHFGRALLFFFEAGYIGLG